MTHRMTRSQNMSRIRSRNTRPELLVRKALWSAGFRYRLNSDLPGHPDLVLPGPRIAVFVDGCFWHGCPVHYSRPSTRSTFWCSKLRENVERDLRVDDALEARGWVSFHIWQHEVRDTDKLVNRMEIMARAIREQGGGTERDSAFPLKVAPDGSFEDSWYRCKCGSESVRVCSIEGQGSLRPKAKIKPEAVWLLCSGCRKMFRRCPPDR